MFFFFPFYAESPWASPNGGGSSQAKILPLLPASGGAKTSALSTGPAWDFATLAADLIKQAISAFTTSLTALANAANALCAQTTALFAYDRVARDAAGFFNGGWFNFAAPKTGASPFGSFRQTQDPMSFSPFLMQGANPSAMNPWAAFAEGMKFWTNLWMPPAPQRSGVGGNSQATPFSTKISAPNGFTWGLSWGV